MKKIITALAAVALTFGAAISEAPSADAFNFGLPAPENLASAEVDIFNSVNAIRAEAGMHTLAWNDGLANSSRSWAQTSAVRDQLAHDPEALNLSDMENVAVMYNNPRDAVNAWMNSPAHRDNIFNPHAKTMGIGVAKNHATGGYFITMRGAY
ncbi:CAP domain-containing protein [Staphylococcus chromogenes]|nr:CAP domain-containing protein [Staphylococcus chromogenes]